MKKERPTPLEKRKRRPSGSRITKVEYTRFPTNTQRDFVTALNGLQEKHFKYVKSAKAWFRWTEDSEWKRVGFTAVHDCMAAFLVEDNCRVSRQFIRLLESEARKAPDMYTSGYLGLQNPPDIRYFKPKTKVYLGRGFQDDC